MPRQWMLYNGQAGDGLVSIGRAVSDDDGLTWERQGIVIPRGAPGSWNDGQVHAPSVEWDGSQHVCYASGYDGATYRIGRWTSTDPDLAIWTPYGSNPVLDLGAGGAFDAAGVIAPIVRYDPTLAPRPWQMWYTALSAAGVFSLGFADSIDGITWTKRGQVLAPGAAGQPDDAAVGGGAVILVDEVYHLLYAGSAEGGSFPKTHTCLATCTDPADPATYLKHGLVAGLEGQISSLDDGLVYDSGVLTMVVRRGGSWVGYGTALHETPDTGQQLEVMFRTTAPDLAGPWSEPFGVLLPLAEGTFDTVSAENPTIIVEASAVVPADVGADHIAAWVTTPAGEYLAHLDRSEASPFRAFAPHWTRNQPGGGALEYHLDNALVRDIPDLLAAGNLVWMRYRGRTCTWIVEEEVTVLDAGEHQTDWRRVSGRGTLQLLADRLVFPAGFAGGVNLDPSTWASQWRSFVNRAAGELLWDLIAESNARFAAAIVRGTVETTGADGITADYRFENLLEDVVKPVTDAFGDVAMEGLTFSYYNRQGVDRTATVIFEEGADLVSLDHERSDRDRVSYLVGEGVGEGVFAKLAVAQRPGARRREAFLAAKEAANVPLLQVFTDAALREHARRQVTTFEADESRFRVFTDYDLGDTIRAVSSSRGVDAAARIDAIYLAEDGDRVRVAIDLGAPRRDDALTIDEEVRRTRSQLGVRNRQPQGQLVPINANGADVFDSTDTMDLLLDVLDEVYVLVRAKVTVAFREFFAPATAAASGGGSTSGASSVATTVGSGAHNHRMFEIIPALPPILSEVGYHARFAGGGDGNLSLKVASAADLYTRDSAAAHQHGMAHDHTTPAHAHPLSYGVFKEAYPASHNVNLAIYRRNGASWDTVVTISNLTDDVEELDVTQYVDGPGLWRFSLQSAGGQPNGGRLAADVAIAVLGAIQSA